MKKEEILNLIKGGETQEVEFKEGCPAHHEISQIICALANTDGGFLIFGVSKKGEIKGLSCNLDRFQQDISNANQEVHSRPIISTRVFEVESKNIVIVKIERSNDKNAHTYKGAVYVRIGSTITKLEGQTLFDFLKKTLAEGTSGNEIKRTVEQGGVEVDGKKVTDPNQKIEIKDGMIVRAGKRKYIKIKITPQV